MATQPESRLQRKIQKALRDTFEGSWWMKVHGGPYQPAGVPDLIGCVDGKFFALEVKIPGKSLSEIQGRTIEKICEAGGVSTAVMSVEEALDAVRQALSLSTKSC